MREIRGGDGLVPAVFRCSGVSWGRAVPLLNRPWSERQGELYPPTWGGGFRREKLFRQDPPSQCYPCGISFRLCRRADHGLAGLA